jgi:hypothetical protein
LCGDSNCRCDDQATCGWECNKEKEEAAAAAEEKAAGESTEKE